MFMIENWLRGCVCMQYASIEGKCVHFENEHFQQIGENIARSRVVSPCLQTMLYSLCVCVCSMHNTFNFQFANFWWTKKQHIHFVFDLNNWMVVWIVVAVYFSFNLTDFYVKSIKWSQAEANEMKKKQKLKTYRKSMNYSEISWN